jgi:hypothetical protein
MARPRLGVGFEGTLYPAPLRPGEMPDLSVAPGAPVMEGLAAAANRFNLAVYPLRPAPGLASAIRGWLLANLERHFDSVGLGDAGKTALIVIDQIEVAHDRNLVRVDFAIDAGGFPRPEDLNRLAPLFETITPALLSA